MGSGLQCGTVRVIFEDLADALTPRKLRWTLLVLESLDWTHIHGYTYTYTYIYIYIYTYIYIYALYIPYLFKSWHWSGQVSICSGRKWWERSGERIVECPASPTASPILASYSRPYLLLSQWIEVWDTEKHDSVFDGMIRNEDFPSHAGFPHNALHKNLIEFRNAWHWYLQRLKWFLPFGTTLYFQTSEKSRQ